MHSPAGRRRRRELEAGQAEGGPYFQIVLIAFNKPFGVLSQFTAETPGQRTLSEFGFPSGVYPIGRLDADSEGLLLLGDEPAWNERLLHPRHAHEREYWAQVERVPTSEALGRLARGVTVQGRKTLPCRAWLLEPQPLETSAQEDVVTTAGRGFPPGSQDGAPLRVPPRVPPIRFRKNVPDCWIGLELVEGKNRQVRRMTAAVGHPTLRLVRVRIGGLWLGGLRTGAWCVLDEAAREKIKRRRN